MLSHEALRQAAQTTPAVLVPSETLLELLDLAAKVEKKTKAAKAAREVDPNDEKCARCLFDLLLETMPKARQPNFKAWAEDVRLMRERDGRKRSEICELFQWAQKDRFWRANILSPAKLRDKWDQLWIVRATAAEPKPAGAGAWWKSDATRLAKAIEVGVGPAHFGESLDSWEARIRAAIDNGGKPPAPPRLAQIVTPPPAAPIPTQTPEAPPRRAGRPEGLTKMLKDLGRAA